MSGDWVDRIVGEAMVRAEQVWDEETELGRLVWALPDGQRCYIGGDDVPDTMTLVYPDGRRTRTQIVGIDLLNCL